MTVPAALAGERIDRVVAMVTGLARAGAAGLVGAAAVVLNGRPVTSRSQRVAAGDILGIELPDDIRPTGAVADAAVHVTVVHADEHVIVVDKPPGIVVHPGSGNPGGTLVNGLLALFPDLGAHAWPDPARPGIVHRLDKGTSGLLVVGRTPDSRESLIGQLANRTVDRRYEALAWGRVEASAGVIDAPLGRSLQDPLRMAVRADGRRAVTHYEVRRRYEDPVPTTLLACRLETGRTHQIRVHLAAIGHPVVGDARYRGDRKGAALAPGRPFLHAGALAFDHPGSGQRCSFEAPLPADLSGVLAGLR
jgi:23S rRNA pseudouridine1911/1915/1917 synthase